MNCSESRKTARLAKFWNAENGYVFDAYEFGKWMVGLSYSFCINQTQYLFNVFDNLSPYQGNTQWRRDRIERAKKIVDQVRQYKLPYTAETEVKKLIPA